MVAGRVGQVGRGAVGTVVAGPVDPAAAEAKVAKADLGDRVVPVVGGKI